MPQRKSAYDYVVVGAGTSGCVLASRLSENPEVEVLLLEAGGGDAHPDVQDPIRWTWLLEGELDWGYRSAPLRSCNHRVDRVPRAKMIGGCHSHNANVWVRGHPSDFDRWEAEGCIGWGWSDALRLYRRIEDWQGPPDRLRGVGGPQYVAQPDSVHPLARAFVDAAPAVGVEQVEGHNGHQLAGAAIFDLTIKDGRRFSVAQAYLLPAMERENLHVLTHAEAHRLLIDGSHCVGVMLQHEQETHEVHVRREVVLCSGVFGSPQLLMRSGIGRADELRALGIDVRVDLSGVGQNLQDHPMVGAINYEKQRPLPPPCNNGAEAGLWSHSREGLDGPDIHAVLLEFPFVTPELRGDLPTTDCYAIAPAVVRVASRGHVTLRSADPTVPPVIDVNYFARQADIDAMLAAVDLCRDLGAANAFDDYRKREVLPGDLSRSDMIEFIRQAATTYFHPAGTCKMGRDRDAVVDPQLSVYGVGGVRVADASIMPHVTSGNTNAPCVLIGEKAAELIIGNGNAVTD